MNAIIALCHFCELHGPVPILCTQTLRETPLDDHQLQKTEVQHKSCNSCNSIGDSLRYMSKDPESNAYFLTANTSIFPETAQMLKMAAIRSLSVEATTDKNGGFIFFGDSNRGHVLSHSFSIKDARARGFNVRFSIIVIMKDKMFLLNIQPFIASKLRIISKELINMSFATFTREESASPERMRRLKSGTNSSNDPRPLTVLTSEPNIYAYLHARFSFILWSGARYLTESITLGSPTVPAFLGRETEEGFALVQSDKETWLRNRMQQYDDHDHLDEELFSSIQRCKGILGDYFISACYCALVGNQIVIKGPEMKSKGLMKCFLKMIPRQMHKLSRANCTRYYKPSEYTILSMEVDVIVPQSGSSVLRIDLNSEADLAIIKWNGELPNKWPDLLLKINKAADEKLFNDIMLDKHMRVLVEDWKNKILCLKKIHSNQELNKMKKVLGVQEQDQQLINYWSKYV